MPSAAIFSVVRKFEVGELITLYKLDLTNFSGGDVYYFTNNVFEEHLPIQFDGQEYVYMPIAMDNIDTSTDSGPAQPRLTIATAGGPVNSLIRTYKDLRGAKVHRIRTFAEFLDLRPDGAGGVEVNPGADSNATLPTDYFVVDRKVSANKTMAEFQLVAPTDQEGIKIPLGIVTKRYCMRVYRYNNGDGTFTYTGRHDPCPWGNPISDGGNYFDINDQPCTAAQDRCSKTLRGCSVRFGNTSALPFGAYPGVKAPNEAG
jgi:lambda family phage minor tail protein L